MLLLFFSSSYIRMWQLDHKEGWTLKNLCFQIVVLDKNFESGTKIAWRNINNLRYADDTTLMTESEEKLKSLLMKVKEESEKKLA